MMIQNPFASPRLVKQPYNYESNLLCNLRLMEALSIIERGCEICDKCSYLKKNHYCVEPKCSRKQLICPECDVCSIQSVHYMHDHTYILPLLSRDISNNFYKMKRKIINYHEEILEEIVKMEDYLVELRKIQGIARNKMEELEEEQENTKIKEYSGKMEGFIKEFDKNNKLSSILENVSFKSAEQCIQKQQEIRNEIISQLNNLKWPKDPQKVLKQKLMKVSHEDEKRQIFISSKKWLELNQIDHNFRVHQQFYTNNLQSHRVQIKVQPDYTSKPKYYESLIYHFRNCKHLSIENASLNQLKTPLTFRRLKTLEFSFNTDMEISNVRIDNVSSPQLTALTFRKCREDDLKVLKNVVSSCSNLKKFHLEFANRIDLFHYKDLTELLQLSLKPTLVEFTLKIRTENQVKRLYGYLSKFYKQLGNQSSCNLSESILKVLQCNPYLTKVVVQGVKPLNMGVVLSRLKNLTYLMDYKIYYQNIDLMTEVDDRQVKQLEDICYKRKRILYALAKASKQKKYPKAIINRIVQEMLI